MLRLLPVVLAASLFAAASTSATEFQVTNDASNDARPAWCPDLTQIAFDSDRAGNRDLWMVSPAGGAAVQLTTSLELDQHPDWSPDATKIVFSASVGGGNPDLYIYDVANGTSTLLHADAGSVDRFPSWSPDGAFIAWSKDTDIYVIPAAGGTPVQVTTDPGSDLHPTWSPDGTEIAFLSNRSGNNDIWRISSGGGAATQVTTNSANDGAPDWSPNGVDIAFQSNRSGNNDIWLIPAAGGAATQVTTDAGNDVQPEWANNGHQLTFARGGNIFTKTFAGVDVFVQMEASATTLTVGQQVTFTVTATNQGPDLATNIVIADQLPLGLDYTADVTSAGAYVSGTGEWTIPSLAALASETLELTATVAPSISGFGATNVATLLSVDQVDGNPYNNEAVVEVLLPNIDLGVTKTVDNPLPNEGDTINYTIIATNLGPGTATSVEITDQLPAGVTFVSAAPSQGTYDDGTGVWNAGSIVAGAALSITATVDAGTAGQTIVNSAEISFKDQVDSDPLNDADDASFTVQSADLSLVASANDLTPDPGQIVELAVELANAGPFTAVGVQVTNAVPTGLEVLNAVATQGMWDAGTGVWTVGNVVNSNSETLTITARVDNAAGGTSIVNSAAVTAANQADPSPADNSDSVTLNVNVGTKLVPEDQITATTFNDQRPAWCPFGSEIVFDSNRSGNLDLWAIAADGSGPLLQLTTNLEVDQHAEWSPDCTKVVFAARVGGGNIDLYVLDRQTLVTTLLHSDGGSDSRFPSWSPDGTQIAFAKLGDIYVMPATGGTAVQVTTDAGNDTHPTWSPDGAQIGFLSNRSGNNDVWRIPTGGGAAVQVTTNPANDGAPDWSPDGTTIAMQSNRSGNNDIWTIPAAGGTATQLTNTTTNDVQPDWAPNGNQIAFARDGELWAVNYGGVDVSLKKMVDDATPDEGGTVVFSVVARNSGPDDATGVVVSDALPAGLTFVGATATNGSYSPGTGEWTVGSLANGVADTLTVTATVDAGTAGATITNTASVTAVNEVDGDAFDDTASAGVDVRVSDLAIAKTVDDAAPGEGDSVDYTVVVTDDSGNGADGATVLDALPAGVTYVGSTATNGSYNDATGEWTLGPIAASGSDTLRVTVTVDAGTAGSTITNTATLTAATPIDGDDTDDEASVDLTVAGPLVTEMQLTSSGFNDQRPAWCSSGQEIAFDSNRAGNIDLWTLPLATGTPLQLTTNLDVDQHAEWNPDCTQIAFAARVGGGNIDLYVVERATLATTLLHADAGSDSRFPSWSPDGTQIAFAKLGDIYVMPAGGGTAVQVTTDPGNDTHPTWSPDGSEIAFLSNRSGNNDIWRIPAGGGAAVQVTTNPANDGAPDWSPDGTTIAMQSNRSGNNDIWTIPAAGGTATQWTTTPDNDVQPEWGPSGHEIAFARSGDLWKLSFDGVGIRVKKMVDDAAPNEGDTVNFTVTARNLGPDDATGVAVADALPAGLTFVSSAATAGSYDAGTGIWTIGAQAAGAHDSLTVTVTVDAGTGGTTITNTASLSSVNEVDGNPFDDSASASVNVQAVDIAVSKDVDNPTPAEGDTITYTIVATNGGASDATAATVSDVLPAGLTFVSSSATNGSYDDGTGEWTLGALANAASDTLSITATVDGGTDGQTLVNTATLAAATPTDTNAGNDTDSASITVTGALATEMQLTSSGFNDQRPAWCSSGQEIAFDSNRAGNIDLWTLPIATGTPLQLTTNLDVDQHAEWNPDCTQIAFAARVGGGNIDLYVVERATLATTLLHADAGSDSRFPSWSPDGTQIAFAKLGDIYVMPAGGGTAVQVTTDPGNDTHPTWSPDGSEIAFLSNRSGNNDIWRIPAGGGAAVQVTTNPANDGAPDWSPDGTTIAMQSNRSGNNDIWTIPAAGGTATQWTTTPDNDVQPEWGPSGHEIAFARSGDLWKLSFDGVGIRVKKMVDDATPNEGDTVNFTVTARNLGPDDATGVAVADALPVGLTYVSSATTAGSYDAGTGVWAIGAQAAGAHDSLTVTVTVDAGTGGTTITNTASLSSVNEVDGNPFDDSASASVNVQAQVDLAVAKAVDLSPALEGDTIQYSIVLTNNGPGDATGVQVADALPAGVTFVSSSATTGSYDDGTGLWTLGAVANAVSDTLTITATVDGGTAGTTITNTAAVTAVDQPDTDGGNDSSSADVLVPVVDLALAKTVDNGSPNEGDAVTYSVVLTNNGPDAASGVTVADTLPAGVTFVSSSATTGSYDDGTGLWTIGAVANAVSDTLTITATVDGGTAGTTITNTASLAGSDQTDGNAANDSASADITVQSIDLALAKSVDNASPNEGDTVTYSVVLTNNGPDAASGVTVADTLPAGVTFVSSSATTGSYDDGTGLWTLGAVANAVSDTLTITATVDGGTAGTAITNTASLAGSDQTDGNAANDSASADITVQSIDLALAKSVDNASPNEGDTVTYSVVLTNNGPDAASGVTVTDTLPAGVTFVSSSATTGSYDDGTGLWTIGAVANAVSDTLTITATVDGGTAGTTITNTASLAGSDQTDGNPANDSDSADITVQSIDLALAKSVDNASPNEGDTVTYSVVLTNNGPDAASGVTVTDALPVGVTFVSSSATTGSYDGGTGLWSIGAVANAVSDTLTITASVELGTAGTTITNTASLAGSDQTDGNPANDSASADITVQSIDLALAKTVDNASPNEGDTVTYSVVLTNNGPDAASGVTVTDALPVGVTFVSSSATTGSYDDGTGLWTIGAVANAVSDTLTITATVDGGTAGTAITNTASLAGSDQTDGNPANDSDSADITVQSIDLALAKSVDNASPNEGDTVTYTVVLTNNGPDAASGVTVADTLPAGVTFVSSSATTGSYDDGTGLWTIGAVANAVSDTLTITATVAGGTAGTTITNTASLAGSDQTDGNPANDSDSADITVQSIDLALAKSVDNASPNEGDTVTYSVVLTNNGPDAASGVTVADTLPAGVTFVSSSATTGSYDGGTGLWSIGAVANAVSDTLTITASVELGTAGTTITNTASLAGSDQTDGNPANDSASADITVLGTDLRITKLVSDATPQVTDVIEYQVIIENVGSLTATNVSVLDQLPAGVTFESYTATEGFYDDISGLWIVGSQSVGEVDTLFIAASVDLGTELSTITNTATRASSLPGDPNSTNDAAQADITVENTMFATMSSLVSRAFRVGDPASTMSPARIMDHPAGATITAANDLRICIPAGLAMTWDPAITSATLTGPAAGKVASTVTYEDGNRTAVLDVTVDFAAGETITLAGLCFLDFTAVSAAHQLELEVGNDDVVTSLDDKFHSILAVGPVATRSVSIDTTPDGSEVWVVNPDLNTVSVIAGTGPMANSLINEINVGLEPWTLAIHADEQEVWVAASGSHHVYVIDMGTYAVVDSIAAGTGTYGVAFNPAGDKALVTATDSDDIFLVDVATRSIEIDFSAQIETIQSEPRGIAWRADGGRAYITHVDGPANEGHGLLTQVHAQSWTIHNQPVDPVTNNPGFNGLMGELGHLSLGPAPADTTLWIPTGLVDSTGTHLHPVLRNINVGPSGLPDLNQRTHYLAEIGTSVEAPVDIDFKAGKAYVANEGSGDVTVLTDDQSGPIELANILVGAGPIGIAASERTERLYVANRADQTVSVIDCATDLIIATVGSTTITNPTDTPEGQLATRTFFENAFPNPMRDAAQLNFAIKEASARVTMEIYDVRGRRVRTLVDEQMTNGFHNVRWDSRNDGGRHVAPGVYFVRMVVDGDTRGKRKMTVLR